MSVGELIEELRRRAGYSKDGKMGEECIVPKTLLADAADKLEKLSNNEAACYYELHILSSKISNKTELLYGEQ